MRTCGSEVYLIIWKLFTNQVAKITIPISSATCESSFSSMHRIKKWLRTSVVQNRFSNIYIERKLTNEHNIIDKFAKTSKKLDLPNIINF